MKQNIKVENNKNKLNLLIGKPGLGIARRYVPPYKLTNSKRLNFKNLYYEGARGFFEGTIIKLEGSACLLNPLLFKQNIEDEEYKYKENFVWIRHFQEKTNRKFKVGDCIKFDGAVNPYKKENGVFEIELAAVDNIRLSKNISQ